MTSDEAEPKEITFTGTLSDVQKQANEWKAANTGVRIVYSGPPIRVGHQDGEDIFNKTDWTITLKYEGQSSS